MKYQGIAYCLTCFVTSAVLTFASGTLWAMVGMICGLAIGFTYGLAGSGDGGNALEEQAKGAG